MKKLRRFEPSCSGIVLHLGLDRVYPQLAHHNFFYSADLHEHFRRVFRDKKLPDDPPSMSSPLPAAIHRRRRPAATTSRSCLTFHPSTTVILTLAKIT